MIKSLLLCLTCIGAFTPMGVSAQHASGQLMPVGRKIQPVPAQTVIKAAGAPMRKAAVARAAKVLTPTWETDFKDDADFELFTTIDANNDATQSGTLYYDAWNYYGNALYYYSVNNTADDWLVSPGFNLKGGRTYKVTLNIDCFMKHTVEVKWGSAATAEAMTQVGVAPTEVSKNGSVVEAMVKPTADGVYYVGTHALSAPKTYNMYMRGWKIEEVASSLVPNEVTDMQLTADPQAALKATISFTAPSINAENAPLKLLDGVKVLRDNVLVADITDDVAPGKSMTYVDEGVKARGMVSYTLVPYNGYGDGVALTKEVYVGLDVPAAPTNILNLGEGNHVSLSWDESVGSNGGVVFPDGITYAIYAVRWDSNGQPQLDHIGSVTGVTKYEFDYPLDEGEQEYVYFGIQANNDAGYSENVRLSSAQLGGKPYGLPMREIFGDVPLQHFWSVTSTGNGGALNPAAGVFSESNAMDADYSDGNITMRTVCNDVVTLKSGKICLKGVANPALSYAFKSGATQGTFRVLVTLPSGMGVYIAEEALTAKDNDWVRKELSLADYTRYDWVTVSFVLDDADGFFSEQTVGIDNVNICSRDLSDLGVRISQYTGSLKPGETIEGSYVVSNCGFKDINGYTVTLKVGDKVLREETVKETLAPGASTKYMFDCPVSVLEQRESLDVVASVKATDDGYDSNDSQTVSVKVLPIGLLRPTELSADGTTGANVLTWKAPADEMTVTEDFENYTPWSIDDCGQWSFIDGDGGDCHGVVDGFNVSYEKEYYPFAYTVFAPYVYGCKNDGYYDITSMYPCVKPKSGQYSLAALHSYKFSMTTYEDELQDADNWLISPELKGCAQDVTFSANNFCESGSGAAGSYEVDYPETFEVLYSTTDKSQSSFTKIDETYSLTGGKWRDFVVSLPEGAKYFAIHHNSKAQVDDDNNTVSPYLFTLDDISYVVANYKVEGYNVYRDGVLVGNTTATTYSDNASGNHLYQVTALYEGGRESSPVTLDVTSGIGGTPSADGLEVKAIYTVDGKKVAGMARGGVYVVEYTNGVTRKVVK